MTEIDCVGTAVLWIEFFKKYQNMIIIERLKRNKEIYYCLSIIEICIQYHI